MPVLGEQSAVYCGRETGAGFAGGEGRDGGGGAGGEDGNRG